LLPAPDSSVPARQPRPASPRILCYVTDRGSLGPGHGAAAVLPKIRDAILARADWVQVREKGLPARELFALAQRAAESQNDGEGATGMGSESLRTKIIVNDRLDVAVAARAAGVHLGRESAPAGEVVGWCRRGNAPREFMIGVSCHSVVEAQEAENAGASYVFFGPVFDTPSKRAWGQPVGTAQLSLVCALLKIPVLAIGGVDRHSARECWRAGAAGIAAIRMFQDARDVDELKTTIDQLRRDEAPSATR
jgi:thiamine-phosphate pyrophosphorylase